MMNKTKATVGHCDAVHTGVVSYYDKERDKMIILNALLLVLLLFDAMFLINVFSGTKQCLSVLETVGIRVPTRNIRNFNTLSCSLSHCPSARCVSAANAVCKYTDIFRKSHLSVKSLRLMYIVIFYVCFVVPFVVVLSCVVLLLYVFVLTL
jgi:hypothetical protein